MLASALGYFVHKIYNWFFAEFDTTPEAITEDNFTNYTEVLASSISNRHQNGGVDYSSLERSQHLYTKSVPTYSALHCDVTSNNATIIYTQNSTYHNYYCHHYPDMEVLTHTSRDVTVPTIVRATTTSLYSTSISDGSLAQQPIQTTGSSSSLALSDSEEESGYMSCTSGGGGKKVSGFNSKDHINNLLMTHSDSSKSLNGSLNDLSSTSEQNDSREQSQDDADTEITYDSQRLELFVADISKSASIVLTSTTRPSPEPEEPEEQLEGEEVESEQDSEAEDESDDESEDNDDEDANPETVHHVFTVVNGNMHTQSSDEEEDEHEEEEEWEQNVEETQMQKPFCRQNTLTNSLKDDDDDDETSSEEEEDQVVEFPDKKKKPKKRQRQQSSESEEGTWISDEDDKCNGCRQTSKPKADSDSDGPDISDFFDGITEDVSYTFHDMEDDENNMEVIGTYPSKEFFHYGRSSPVYQSGSICKDDDDDDDDDFSYLYSSDLKTGKRYAFPRREPRTISDAVDFWETDFEVGGSIYPCMSSWEAKSLAPTYEEDADDYMKYTMYKSLYEKWVKCNRSRDQWYQRYWGRDIEHVARMKGPPKRPITSSQSDSAIYSHSGLNSERSSVDLSDQSSVAERRRRRRTDAMSTMRGMY